MKRTPIFDTVRNMLGRGLEQQEVDRLDRAIDNAVSGASGKAQMSPLDCVPSVPSCRISERGIALIKQFEGCARLRPDGLVEAYPDPGTGGHPWTIGWGATGREIGPGTVWTQAQCDARFERDLGRYADDVARALGDAPTTQPQFDALVSFHYNTGAIARATLTKRHRAGDFAKDLGNVLGNDLGSDLDVDLGVDFDGAMREFMRWNKAGGKVLKGLSRRRAAEAKLYASRQ